MNGEPDRAMTPWQQRLVETYGGGDYAHVTTLNEAMDVGDTLFTFLFVELDPKEDCDTLDEAIRRVVVATRDLFELRDVLNALSLCSSGIHSWSDAVGKLPADTKCTHCGELCGDPD